MTSKWLSVFKEIHGRTPTKDDYHLAPKNVKEELLGDCKEEITEVIPVKSARKSSVRLKRPADDQFSPFKPLPKRHAEEKAAGFPIQDVDLLLTPVKSSESMEKVLTQIGLNTPIRSPQKSCKKGRQILNVFALLAPTPEKQKEVIDEEPQFETAEVPAVNTTRKTKTNSTTRRSTKNKENYVRINLKKKSFTRGKVSAEAKRKLRKKQMWKKRVGGAR